MLQCVSDSNSESRLNGRKSFLVWQRLNPENAQSLFTQFDYQSQKAVMEEQDKFHELDELDLPERKDTVTSAGAHKATTANSSTAGSLSNQN